MELSEQRAAEDPIKHFERWRREAQEAGEIQPDAMALATSGKDGHPSARFVMLRGLDQRGFVFYTNYSSRKAKELAEVPWGSLAFYWPRCERQVRVEGPVEPVGKKNPTRTSRAVRGIASWRPGHLHRERSYPAVHGWNVGGRGAKTSSRSRCPGRTGGAATGCRQM